MINVSNVNNCVYVLLGRFLKPCFNYAVHTTREPFSREYQKLAEFRGKTNFEKKFHMLIRKCKYWCSQLFFYSPLISPYSNSNCSVMPSNRILHSFPCFSELYSASETCYSAEKRGSVTKKELILKLNTIFRSPSALYQTKFVGTYLFCWALMQSHVSKYRKKI